MLGPIASTCSPSLRSSGSRVVLPPSARIASSVSSNPPCVRAVATTWTPCRASSMATAAPMPRLAPVTSATEPDTVVIAAGLLRCARNDREATGGKGRDGGPAASVALGQQAQLPLGIVGLVRERYRIIAGEAGIAV